MTPNNIYIQGPFDGRFLELTLSSKKCYNDSNGWKVHRTFIEKQSHVCLTLMLQEMLTTRTVVLDILLLWFENEMDQHNPILEQCDTLYLVWAS